MRQSQLHNLVVMAVGLDGAMNLPEKLQSVTGQEIHATDRTLLKAFVRV